MIKRESIDKVLETARLEEVIGDFVQLKRSGTSYTGLCPFHRENTPSFVVTPGKNIYKCFGCQKGGNDAARFLMDLEQMSFPEAIRWLANRYNIELEETKMNEEEREKRQVRETLFVLNTFAAEYYQRQLFDSDLGKSVGLSYFKQRGFREETIRKFGLGFAPDGRDTFTREALGKGYEKAHLLELGLTRDSGVDFFRNRVMFPIHNLSGKVVGMAGRILNKRSKAPKYINSKENQIYNKRRQLYGLWQARQEIQRRDRCVLVEGYTDVISMHQAGLRNVVAASGTSLTEEQVQLIKRFTPNMTLLFDGDPAGIRAAVRGVDLVIQQGMNVRVAVLPEGDDPDSYVKSQGAAGLEQFLEERSRDFVFFKIDLLREDAGDDPVKRSAIVQDILQTVALMPDPILRSEYIKDISRILEIGEELLTNKTNKLLTARLQEQARRKKREAQKEQAEESPAGDAARPEAPEQRPAPAPTGDEYQERDIARILVVAGDQIYDEKSEQTVADFVLQNMEDVLEEFDNELYQRIVRIALDQRRRGEPVLTQLYARHEDERIQRFVADVLSSPHVYSENWELKWDIRLQTQRMPEENYRRDSQMAYKRFMLRKVVRMYQKNQDLIRKLAGEDAGGELEDRLRLQHKLLEMRQQLADELGTVVLK